MKGVVVKIICTNTGVSNSAFCRSFLNPKQILHVLASVQAYVSVIMMSSSWNVGVYVHVLYTTHVLVQGRQRPMEGRRWYKVCRFEAEGSAQRPLLRRKEAGLVRVIQTAGALLR